MNSQIEALGEIAKFTHSLNGNYSGWTTERGNYMGNVEFGGTVLSLHAKPENEYVTAFTDRMLSRVEGFNHRRHSVEIVNAEELNKLEVQLDISAVSLTTLTESVDGIEYFDGFRAELPLFVNENFGPQKFYERLVEVEDTNRKAFNKSLDMLDIDIGVDEAAGSDEEVEGSSPAFQ